MNIQYLGFEQNPKFRTYSFRVVEVLKQNREFQLSVENQSLVDIKFKFQDLPDLCFSKLKRDLAVETDEQIVPLRIRVSEAELQKYIADHYPSKHKRNLSS
jgi:hypothetical protein